MGVSSSLALALETLELLAREAGLLDELHAEGRGVLLGALFVLNRDLAVRLGPVGPALLVVRPLLLLVGALVLQTAAWRVLPRGWDDRRRCRSRLVSSRSRVFVTV